MITVLTSNEAVVQIKSAWVSKINWVQVATATASLAVLFAGDLSAEAKAQIVVSVTTIASAATVVLRTWFNASVTPESLP